MLLANRKKRGKKKLANKWESTIYMVVDMNEMTHTYRICDTATGREKVVHRNLPLLANFLPVGNTSEMSDLPSPTSSAESSVKDTDVDVAETLLERESEDGCECSGDFDAGSVNSSSACMSDGVSHPTDSPVDSERKTIEWLSQLSAPSLSQVDATDITSVSSGPTDNSALPGNIMTNQSVTCDSGSVTNTADGNTTQTINAPHTLYTVDQTSVTNCDLSDAQTRIRSRFGQIIKPVTRLIQTMSRQDVVQDKFGVKSVCKFMLQSLIE